MKGLYCCFLLLLLSFVGWTQTITSAQDGDWNVGSTWVGGNVPTPSNSVDIASGHNIRIPSGYGAVATSVTITNNNTTDLTIDDGGSLTFTGTLTTGTLTRGRLFMNGILNVEEGASISGTQAIIGATGKYRHNYHTVAGTIYSVVWNAGSTLEIVGYTSNTSTPSGLTQTFRNVTWNCPGQENDILLTGNSIFATVNGNFSVVSTNGFILGLNPSVDRTHNFNGNLTLSPSVIFDINSGSTNTTINLAGSLSIGSDDALAIQSAGVGTINFVGSSVKTITSAALLSTPIHFNVSTSAVVSIPDGNFLSGPGDFTLAAGGTLEVGSSDGLVIGTGVGAIQVSGVRDYVANGTIVYNGTGPQSLGDEWSTSGALSGIAVNLQISNSSGVTNNIIGTTSIVGKLTLTNGPFNIGNSNTLVIEGDFEGYNGTSRLGTISGHTSPTPSSSLTFAGSGSITGTLNFTANANSLKNFVIDRAGTVTIGTNLTIHSSGELSFLSSGSLQFDAVADQTLTINGDITQVGSGGLSSGTTQSANLVIGGSGSVDAIPFCTNCGTMQLNNLSLLRTGTVTYPFIDAVRINGVLDLTSGTLSNSAALIMNAGSTFLRRSNTSITGSALTANPSYSVSYFGTITAPLLELPTSATALDNLTVAGTVPLDHAVTINGDLTINSGTFNAGTFPVAVNGEEFTINGGTFTMGSANTITFGRAGSTVMAGLAIGGTQFGNVTINSGTTLSAPNANINISGAWENLGTFAANTGTVTFNGTSQGIDAAGQPFNNVVFANSGTKSLAGALDVNGSLTINTGVTLDAESSSNSINVGGTWNNAGTFVANGNTVTFDGAGAQTISEVSAFYNLQLAGGGTKTLGRALDVDNDFEIGPGVTFSTSASNHNITLGGDWTNNGTFTTPGTGGTITFNGTSVIGGSSTTRFRNITIQGAVTAPASTLEIGGTWLYSSGTFTANGGTVIFNGNVAQSITPGGQSFHHVTIAGSNTKTLQGNIDINGNLTLNNSAAIFSVGSDRAVTLAGNFDASGAGVLQAQTGTFTFDGAAQSITSAGESFYNVSFTGSGTKTLQDAFDANGLMDINVALAAGSNDIHVGGDWDATGGSFTTTGTTTFDGAAQNILSNGSSFGSVVLAGSGTKLLHSALDVNGNLSLTSTLDVNTSNYAITVGGNWDTSIGTFTSRAGLVTLDGTTQSIALGAANSFNSLTLSGSGTKTQLDAIDVNANLLIGSTAVLDAGDNDLTLAGNITTNGSYLPGASTLTLNGGGGQSLAGSTATNYNSITVNKASGTAIVSTAQNLINALTLTSGTLNANGMLTLVSSATGDARIAEITGGSITGKIIAQRYMHITATLPTGGVYRYFASPVTDAFVSDLKDDFPVTGTFNDPSTQAEWPGLNVTSTARIMFFYNEAHQPTSTTEDRYESYPLAGTNSTAAPLVNGRGYSARIRQTTPIVIDLPGTPRTGDVPVNVTAQSNGGNDGWNMIGNPYPAPISWDKVTIPAGVNAQIALKDNANNSGIGEGQYVYYTQGGTGIPASYDGNIPSGQAFWVRATSNATITFQENDKQDISNPSFMRVAPVADILRINVTGNNRMDELVIRFKEDATDAADQNYDAFKLQNDFINFSSLSADSVKMAINVLGGVSCNKEVGLVLDNVTPGAYSLNFSQFESFNDKIQLRLLDSFTGVVFDIDGQNPVYQFNVTDNPNSFGKKRFKVYAGYPDVQTALTFQGEDVCIGANARVAIQDTQEGVKYFPTINGNTVGDEVISDGGVVELFVNSDKLVDGENTVVLMASIAGCTAVPLDNSAKVNQEAIYAIKSVTGGKTCGEGQVSLSADGAPSDGFYRWYEAVDSQSPIAGQTTSTFVTPVLNKAKTYFVSAVNALGCEGERVEVLADVSLFEDVSISVSEGSLTSSYPTGNQWYLDGEAIPGATGQTIEAMETGLYEVEAKLEGGCTTRAGQEMIVMGIEDPLGKGYSFYPNPVETQLNITLPNATDASGYIQSAQGRTLGNLRFSASGGKMTAAYNFENESAGLYIVRIFQGNRILNYKIIKR